MVFHVRDIMIELRGVVLWGQIEGNLIPASAFTNCVALRKLLNLSEPDSNFATLYIDSQRATHSAAEREIRWNF